MITIHRVTCA